jgi:hypothetical protein
MQRVTVVLLGFKIASSASWGLWGLRTDGTDVNDWHSISEELDETGTVKHTACWPVGIFQLSVMNTYPGCSDAMVNNLRAANATLPPRYFTLLMHM